MRRFTSRSELPSMEDALRKALSLIGSGDPNIGFITADDELDEVAVYNTNRSGEYRYST